MRRYNNEGFSNVRASCMIHAASKNKIKLFNYELHGKQKRHYGKPFLK
jgi:hypothetical protein